MSRYDLTEFEWRVIAAKPAEKGLALRLRAGARELRRRREQRLPCVYPGPCSARRWNGLPEATAGVGAVGGRYHRKSGCVVGPAYVAGAVLTRRIGGKLAAAPGAHRINLAKSVNYLMKGADKQATDIMSLSFREPGGAWLASGAAGEKTSAPVRV